jgi:hypothetical protein
MSDAVSNDTSDAAAPVPNWSDRYVQAGVPFPFPGVRLAITIRHDAFTVGLDDLGLPVDDQAEGSPQRDHR